MRAVAPCPMTGDVSRAKQLYVVDVLPSKLHKLHLLESITPQNSNLLSVDSVEDNKWPNAND